MTARPGVVRGVEERLDDRIGDLYLERVWTHMADEYVGIRMRKFPEDLHTLERIVWDQRVDTVVELGTGHGGSALWFRDRLRTFRAYRGGPPPLVVSADRAIDEASWRLEAVDPGYAADIHLVAGDIRHADLADAVRSMLSPARRILVVEDSAHMYDTTLAALRNFADLVPVDGFFVVEDGHRDYPGMLPDDMPSKVNGVLVAVDEWLASDDGRRFAMRRDQERYVVTSNPRGWLQRVS